MKTKKNLDEDVLDKARSLKDTPNTSFRSVINQTLRFGLEKIEQPTRRKPYRTRPHAMGLCEGYNLDNIQELLAQDEGG